MTANDVWTCCACLSPNLIANADVKCPVCSHTKCVSCPLGAPGLSSSAYVAIALLTSVTTPSIPSVIPRYSPFPNNITLPCEGNTTAECRSYQQYELSSFDTLGRPPLSLMNISPIASTGASKGCSFSHGGSGIEPLMYSKPSTVGWWECHSCRWANNPALYPRNCSNCPHKKCTSCIIRTY